MDVDDRSILPRLAWHARDVRRRIGLPGVIGVLILLAAVVFYGTVAMPAAYESAALAKDIAALEAARGSPSDNAQKRAPDPVQQLEEFYRFFPRGQQAADDLARLHGAAAAHNVQLEQGTYRMVKDRVGKLFLYEITLPVRGDYPQIRKFISQVLTEIPHLALDSVSFQRQKAGDATLESQIKFTLFLGEKA